MSYGLSFASDFFKQDDDEVLEYPVDEPASLYQAIRSMPEHVWSNFCRDVFGCGPEHVDVETVLAHVEEIDTCSNLDSPVEVWLDEDGCYTVEVYD